MKLRCSRHGNHISQFVPANLLGNVNSGNWDSLTGFTMPFDSEGNPHEPDSNALVIEDDRFWTGFSCWPPRFCYERATEFRLVVQAKQKQSRFLYVETLTNFFEGKRRVEIRLKMRNEFG